MTTETPTPNDTFDRMRYMELIIYRDGRQETANVSFDYEHYMKVLDKEEEEYRNQMEQSYDMKMIEDIRGDLSSLQTIRDVLKTIWQDDEINDNED